MSDDLRRLAADLAGAKAEVWTIAAVAVEKATRGVERDAKLRAPVRTGNLRSSITSEVRVGPGEVVGEVGPTAEYGAHVEYGTLRMSPRPYMGPAVDVNEPVFLAAFDQIGDLFQ